VPPAIHISDRYRVLRQLGRGGMATVYLARDSRYERDVAIKVLNPEISHGVGADRFLREISVAAKLTHPHIVPLLDSGAADDMLWFAMPVLEGRTLRERLDQERELSISDAVRIACEVAGALAYAHARDVVHRDIKPENVLLSSGSAVVADFGLAKGIAASGEQALTHTGIAVGTVVYMSPEQSTGTDQVDGRSDIYSLGCTLYEMLTGEPPYVGKTAQAIIAKRFSDPVPDARRLRSSVSPALDAVIARAMAKSPADRFQTADAFADALVQATDASRQRGETTPRTRLVRRVTIVGAALVAAVVLVALIVPRVRSAGTDGGVRQPRSIAVLPFANLSDDKEQEYFSAGMTDELLGALSAIKQLRIAARTSTYAVKNQGSDIRRIGSALNVEAVIEGSVRKQGDHVRVSVELVNVADGFRIWGETYDKKLSDVFAMQEQIAQAIVSAIQIQLGAGHAIVRQTTEDVAAYEMYLRGRHAVDMRTPKSLDEAAGWFRKAVDRDPLYARAWAGLADVYILQGLNLYAPPKDAYAKGEAAARKAVSLDSTLAESHTSLGTVRFLYDRDYVGAEAEYQRALALDPSYPAAHYFYALLLVKADPAHAEQEATRAQELDPLSPPIAQGLGIVRVGGGRYADAIGPLQSAIALDPDYYFPHAWLAVALAHVGPATQAVAEARRAVALNPSSTLVLAYLGEVYAITGDRRSALAVTAKLDSISMTRPVCGVFVARIYDRLGDADHAFAWLARATEAREGQLSQLLYPDTFPHISHDPRFAALVRQLGLQ
jgi:serine/threonine-protein kinase